MIRYDHDTGEKTWITPPPRLQQSLGHFDLDPCAADDMPYRTAERMITKNEDGLKVDWKNARVWLNPPYGRESYAFLAKMRRGIALLPVRCDSKWFGNYVVPRCHSICFIQGRVRFLDKQGKESNSPAFGSMLVSYSEEDTKRIFTAIQNGAFKGAVFPSPIYPPSIPHRSPVV